MNYNNIYNDEDFCEEFQPGEDPEWANRFNFGCFLLGIGDEDFDAINSLELPDDEDDWL